MTIGVSYGDDLEKVKEVTLQTVKQVTVLDADEPPGMFYQEFADSSVNFTLQLWINSTEQPIFLQAQSEAIVLLKKAYDENNIMLPFPVRTLDFGVKGGVTLAEALPNIFRKEEIANKALGEPPENAAPNSTATK